MRSGPVIAFFWLFSSQACSGAGPGDSALGQALPESRAPKYFQGPPKPGASITASQKCECYACDPDHCCAGGDESTGESECSDGLDFSRCNMFVESCTTRCFQKVWRVPNGESCDVRRPAECCAGG
jgi:hypothetical protein